MTKSFNYESERSIVGINRGLQGIINFIIDSQGASTIAPIVENKEKKTQAAVEILQKLRNDAKSQIEDIVYKIQRVPMAWDLNLKHPDITILNQSLAKRSQ
jgi:hypothetical protein